MRAARPDSLDLPGPTPRVLLVAEDGNSGGIGRYCLDLCALLGAQAALVCLCSEVDTEDCDDCWLARQAAQNGTRIIPISMPAKSWRDAYRQLRAALVALENPVLHVNGRRGNFLALLTRAAGDVSFATTAHGVLGTHYRGNMVYRHVDRWTWSEADAVIAVSSHTYRQLLTAGVEPNKTRRVLNALPRNRIEHMTQTSLRKPAPRTTESLVVGYLGRLGPEKGIEEFGRLALRLAAEVPGVRFRVAGEGPRRAWLSRECRQLLASETMELLGEVQDPTVFLGGIDILVMPSRNEGLPYALLEAMAAGCAVVAYGVGGIPELVRDSGLGVVVGPGDRLRLYSSLRQLLSNPELVARIGEAAAAQVAARYTLESRLPELEEVYALCGASFRPKEQ